MTDDSFIDPWLDENSLRAAAQLGLTPREYVDQLFAAERESLGHRVQQIRLLVQSRRRDLASLQQARASDDAIAAMDANIERALQQIADLMLRSGRLDERHRAALAELASRAPLDSDDAVAEAERHLRDDR